MEEIFVSYSRKDGERATRLVRRLESLGYSVWMDQDDLRVGRLWRKQIVEGVEGCRLYVIVLTANAVHSDNVRRELDLARMRNKPILPLYSEPEPSVIPKDMEYQLIGLQHLSYERLFEDSAKEVLDDLMSVPQTEEMPPGDLQPPASLRHESGAVIPLLGGRQLVGRGPDARIDLTRFDSRRYVSKRHAELVLETGGWMLRPCDEASNPTLLNGVAVPKGEEVELKDGDRVTFANLTFLFQNQEERP